MQSGPSQPLDSRMTRSPPNPGSQPRMDTALSVMSHSHFRGSLDLCFSKVRNQNPSREKKHEQVKRARAMSGRLQEMGGKSE